MSDGWTYSNAPDPRPLTIDDIRQAAEKLRPIGDELCRLSAELFAAVAVGAAKQGCTWDEAADRLLSRLPAEQQVEMREALNAARAVGRESMEDQMTIDEVKITYPDGLKMWTADHEEWCIAADAEDAAECYAKMAGERLEFGPGEPALWTEEPPGALFRFNDDGVVIAKTNAEWVRDRGRGYFASANI